MIPNRAILNLGEAFLKFSKSIVSEFFLSRGVVLLHESYKNVMLKNIAQLEDLSSSIYYNIVMVTSIQS